MDHGSTVGLVAPKPASGGDKPTPTVVEALTPPTNSSGASSSSSGRLVKPSLTHKTIVANGMVQDASISSGTPQAKPVAPMIAPPVTARPAPAPVAVLATAVRATQPNGHTTPAPVIAKPVVVASLPTNLGSQAGSYCWNRACGTDCATAASKVISVGGIERVVCKSCGDHFQTHAKLPVPKGGAVSVHPIRRTSERRRKRPKRLPVADGPKIMAPNADGSNKSTLTALLSTSLECPVGFCGLSFENAEKLEDHLAFHGIFSKKIREPASSSSSPTASSPTKSGTIKSSSKSHGKTVQCWNKHCGCDLTKSPISRCIKVGGVSRTVCNACGIFWGRNQKLRKLNNHKLYKWQQARDKRRMGVLPSPVARIPCTFPGCTRKFRSNAGLSTHLKSHGVSSPAVDLAAESLIKRMKKQKRAPATPKVHLTAGRRKSTRKTSVKTPVAPPEEKSPPAPPPETGDTTDSNSPSDDDGDGQRCWNVHCPTPNLAKCPLTRQIVHGGRPRVVCNACGIYWQRYRMLRARRKGDPRGSQRAAKPRKRRRRKSKPFTHTKGGKRVRKASANSKRAKGHRRCGTCTDTFSTLSELVYHLGASHGRRSLNGRASSPVPLHVRLSSMAHEEDRNVDLPFAVPKGSDDDDKASFLHDSAHKCSRLGSRYSAQVPELVGPKPAPPDPAREPIRLHVFEMSSGTSSSSSSSSKKNAKGNRGGSRGSSTSTRSSARDQGKRGAHFFILPAGSGKPTPPEWPPEVLEVGLRSPFDIVPIQHKLQPYAPASRPPVDILKES